jgi:hypothetical protein
VRWETGLRKPQERRLEDFLKPEYRQRHPGRSSNQKNRKSKKRFGAREATK